MTIPQIVFWNLCMLEGGLRDGVYTWISQLEFTATFPDGVSYNGSAILWERIDGPIEVSPPLHLPENCTIPRRQFAEQAQEYYLRKLGRSALAAKT